MSTERLDICPKCECDGCYVTPINETKSSYFCWGCGYQTNDLMVEGEFNFEEFEETLPELYKEAKHIDSNNRVWYPAVINAPTKGVVFLFGTEASDVRWAAIKEVRLTESEQREPKYKGFTYKSDAKTLKYFGNDFIEACDYIGFFNLNET